MRKSGGLLVDCENRSEGNLVSPIAKLNTVFPFRSAMVRAKQTRRTHKFVFSSLILLSLPIEVSGMALIPKTARDRSVSWLEIDPNPTTRAHLQSCTDTAVLERLFPSDESRRISFGTAGLRAPMQPGPLGMNDVTVLQTAQGIAQYCSAAEGTCNTVIVIGYDHRASNQYNLSSRRFALLSALVLRKAGTKVILLNGYMATPLVPFTMQQQQQDGVRCMGIMVTASHNPKEDAGYKVYGDDACQIRSPIDAEIARHIQGNLDPWIDYETALADLEDHTNTSDPCYGLSDPEYTQRMIDAYFRALGSASAGLKTVRVHDHENVPKFCYSAMHGVGFPFVKRAFEEFGLPPFVSVSQQQQPDPDFPTVTSPNPEEQGALDLSHKVAEDHGCVIVLANDPDADRLAVSERSANGTWVTFTGDQIGALLGHWMWTQHKHEPNSVVSMCASTVSSKFLSAMAKAESFHFQETLAGFKWIGSCARALHGKQAPGQRGKIYNSVFSYEESLGYCCGSVVFEKDGISASTVLSQLALRVYSEGITLAQHLQSLYDTYGEFVSRNGYFLVRSTDDVPKLMEQLHGVEAIGCYGVASSRYLGEAGSYDTAEPDGLSTLPCGPPMVTLRFDNGCTAQFRPSGTEPKFKYYFELQGQPGVPRAALSSELETMRHVVLKALFGDGLPAI